MEFEVKYHFWYTEVNLCIPSNTYITVADLSVLLLMTFNTIVTVFTVMKYVLLYYHDMVNFNYHPALMHTSTHTHMYIHMDTHTCTAHSGVSTAGPSRA